MNELNELTSKSSERDAHKNPAFFS